MPADGAALSAATAADNWAQAASACRARLLADAPPLDGDVLGLIYITDRLAGDMSAILAYFREALPDVLWIGGVGSGVCAMAPGEGATWFDQPAMSAMLIPFPANSLRVFSELTEENLSENIRRHTEDIHPVFGLVHGDPRVPNISGLISQLSRQSGAFLAGGLCASRGAHPQIAGDVVEGGLSGVLFSPDIAVATGLTQSCAPIGPARIITECADDHILVKLDGRPAFEAMTEDLRETLTKSQELNNNAAVSVLAAFPISGSDTGDYLARNISGVDQKKGWVAMSETVVTGDRVMFCRRTPEYAAEDMQRMTRDLRRRCGKEPRGGVYISCAARGSALFDRINTEIEAIVDEFGSFPLVGFFSNGEISHDRLYGHAGVLILFL